VGWNKSDPYIISATADQVKSLHVKLSRNGRRLIENT
jgi:hypothetical protein